MKLSEEKSHFRIRKGDVEIEYSGKPSDVNRQFKVASEWVKGIIVVTPPPNASEERNKDKDEEREFQVEMLKVQLVHGAFTSIMTALIAVAISWIAAMATIYYSNVPTDVKSFSAFSSILMLFVAVIGFIAFQSVSFAYIPRQLSKLHERFIKSKKTENPKQDSKEKEPKEARDKFFLFYGIVMGAVLGFFGNICASWYYESYKVGTTLWLYLGLIAFIVFFSALIISAHKMSQWVKMVK